MDEWIVVLVVMMEVTCARDVEMSNGWRCAYQSMGATPDHKNTVGL